MVEGNDIFGTTVQALKVTNFVNLAMDTKALMGNFNVPMSTLPFFLCPSQHSISYSRRHDILGMNVETGGGHICLWCLRDTPLHC